MAEEGPDLFALPELVVARVREMAANGGGRMPRRFSRGSGGRAKAERRGVGRFSGPGPDARDPQPVLGVATWVVANRGWKTSLSVGSVLGRWPEIVGSSIAAHCTPERFEASVLEIAADSTAWATQLTLMVPDLQRRLDEELGAGVVKEIKVRGPRGSSFRRGPRTVRGGRGPRDTFG